jgi:hypothetical protein
LDVIIQSGVCSRVTPGQRSKASSSQCGASRKGEERGAFEDKIKVLALVRIIHITKL